ncbi:CocE/NonD family hydrolase [Streptomyces sp. WI04-05B]|uniref:CocE/NonD family hydrolase n=1 Tax=Streptomyces TaxID=1883 RepID=UPI0029AD948A|nr:MULTISPECIES: CocE/NonD family hydrolase [unclassified Streptomyces]MDX2549034.1 CocE/NonD family hydrolase [Streptomyces sp. WI04-05B]MDX2583311.1 CocE/NonD family hydrolase [Streptomyces sp. WI04-05A]
MAEIRIEFDVPAQMSDGTVLRADVYRPGGTGPWPVLLSRLPYGKQTPMMGVVLEPLAAARRGFMVVLQDTRGRFASEGEWEPWTYEESDGYDTVRWAATLPGSNGSVGMIGGSYFGNTQWMAALSKPPELKAIAPMITWSDPDDGLFSRGGAIELGITVPWSLMQGADTLMRRHRTDPGALVGSLGGLVQDLDGLAGDGYGELPAGRFPAFARHDLPELGYERSRRELGWARSCTVAGRHDEVDLPTFQLGGWYDIFTQGTLDNFTAMRRAGRSATLIMGPWTHTNWQHVVGDVNFGFAAHSEFMGMRGRVHDLQFDWFARTLGEGAALEPDTGTVLLFVMGTNQWREETEWPLSRAVDTDFHLRAGGRLTREPPTTAEQAEEFTYDPMDPVPTTGGALLMTDEFRTGPLDQTAVEAREDVLVFTTEPLTDDVEVTGRVRAVLFAATDGPSTDWVARLCDVDENGVSRNVADGIVRVRAATPGEAAEHVVDLWSTSIVFRAGHRIRVQVTSSNFPRWDRNLNTGEPEESATTARVARQQVFHDPARPSRVILPVVPA